MITIMDINDCWVAKLSDMAGTTEAAMRLLITILAAYPVAFLYRGLIQPLKAQTLHHLFFALSGAGLCYFNYGYDTYHSFVAIVASFVMMRLFYRTPAKLVTISFTFHMLYLLIGYYFTESNDYDILWTMPHCVLVLRLIGFAFDVADGRKPKNELSKDQQECALKVQPTLLELLAFAYFPASFLVGPQFPFQRYKRFLQGEFKDKPGCTQTGLRRLAIGLIYLGVRQVLVILLPEDYFLTNAYANQAFIIKIIYLGVWGKSSLYKYISIWLISEGALMCLGFSYNGRKPNGEPDWYGCSNVKLWHLEAGTNMQHYVQSFNVNTNLWVSQYVYKRLKFLNNRTISYVGALVFLAVWHGFHSGYYMSFLLEYLTVTTEKQIEQVYLASIKPNLGETASSPLYKNMLWLLLKAYNVVYMGFCLTPFIFLSYGRWLQVFRAVNFYGFYYLGGWLVVNKLYKYMKVNDKTRPHSDSVFSKATDLSPTVGTDKYNNKSSSSSTNVTSLSGTGQDVNFSKATDLSPTLQNDKKVN